MVVETYDVYYHVLTMNDGCTGSKYGGIVIWYLRFDQSGRRKVLKIAMNSSLSATVSTLKQKVQRATKGTGPII